LCTPEVEKVDDGTIVDSKALTHDIVPLLTALFFQDQSERSEPQNDALNSAFRLAVKLKKYHNGSGSQLSHQLEGIRIPFSCFTN
jgi:hypothetical protein